jgi:hypothetical protein
LRRSLYGVGAGEDPSEGEADSSASAAFFFFAVVFFLWVGIGVGETLAVAAPPVDVAVVPCCVQETINAVPIMTVMNVKTDLFIVTVGSSAAECPVTRQMASIKQNPKTGCAPLR